jgi:hypothetical protein
VADDTYSIGDEFAAEWNRIRDKVDGASGPGLHNTPTSLSHANVQPVGGTRGLPPLYRIQIVNGISGQSGRYTGYLYYTTPNHNPSGALVKSDFGKAASQTVELWNPSEVGGGAPLVAGQIVLAVLGGFDGNTGKAIYFSATALWMFPVQVSVDGGVAGSLTSSQNCTLTYSLFDIYGNALKDSSGTAITTQTPDVPRFPTCKYNTPSANSPGLAYRDSAGTVHLYAVAQEIPATATVNTTTTVSYSGGAWQYSTTPILVLDKGNEGSPITYVTGSGCP